MNEHPATLRDELEKLSPDAQRLLNWVANWLVAWEWCDGQGWCDGLGSHEFRRLSAQAQAEGLAASQTTMRLWIKLHANLPPDPYTNSGGGIMRPSRFARTICRQLAEWANICNDNRATPKVLLADSVEGSEAVLHIMVPADIPQADAVKMLQAAIDMITSGQAKVIDYTTPGGD